MGINFLCLVVYFQVLLASHQAVASNNGSIYMPTSLTRSSFPEGFIFGAGSSAYQYEGAANEGGRGPCLWDTFTKTHPEKIKDHSDGSVAVDQYHRYKEDVRIMKNIGLNAYRMSISWSRVLPHGTRKGGVNLEGLQYYNNLIDELLSRGIQPFVTLLHFDPPQDLQDAYGGFLSSNIVNDFTEYAEVCFEEFGDRVKHWMTVNEPSVFAQNGYGAGIFPPMRCSKWFGKCSGGDSSVEPYLVLHHHLLAHARAVQVYRQKYQIYQKGQIGVVTDGNWVIPASPSSKDDVEAASRHRAFNLDWFLEPLNYGSYPDAMVKILGEKLPRFSSEESMMVKGSFDFIGLNYYTTRYATPGNCPNTTESSIFGPCVVTKYEINGIPIGPKTASGWIYVYPKGIQQVLLYIKEKYGNPVIYITENGFDETNDHSMSLKDNKRINFIAHHLQYIHSAIRDGVDVRGYFLWSLLDNFDLVDGYTVRFGLVFIDYEDNLKRYMKKSTKWMQNFLQHKTHKNSS